MTEEIFVGIAVFLATSVAGIAGNFIYKRYLRDKAFPTRIDAVETGLINLAQVSNVLLTVNIAQTESIGTILTASKATLEALQDGKCNGNVTSALRGIDESLEKHESARAELTGYIQSRAKIKVG